MKKILLIHNIINPTRTQFFNELYLLLKENWFLLKIIFLSENENNRKRNTEEEILKFLFPFHILSSKQLKIWGKDKFYFHINQWIWKYINDEDPDVIIHAWWASFSTWLSLIRCKYNKKEYILWNESTKYELSWRRTITKPLVKLLVYFSDKYLSFWTRATEYLMMLWANKYKICQIYNTVDIDYFLWEAERLKPYKEELKKKYWINTKNVLLFVGQFIERKGVYEILEWFKNFQKDKKDRSLVFVWWWQEKEKMKQIIKEQNIKNVFFPWFFQKDKISELYTIADVFTLPSKEEVRWLVINEAMCFWLPIITGYRVWASEDLVKEWENWYIMKEYNWEEFEKSLDYILYHNLINKNNSLKIIKECKISCFINKIKNFI